MHTQAMLVRKTFSQHVACTTNWIYAKNTNYMHVARTSNNRVNTKLCILAAMALWLQQKRSV